MRASRILFAASVLTISVAPLLAVEVSVMNHGARGDGRADDRAAIQAAIDAVDKAGGGTVHFPAGVYAVTLRNTISGAYSSGIDLNCVAKNMEIAGNTLIDPGRGVDSKELKCGMRLRDSLENVRILNNAFYSHQAEAITCGIYDLGNNLGGGRRADNRISSTAAADLPVYWRLRANWGRIGMPTSISGSREGRALTRNPQTFSGCNVPCPT